ncbi:MAG: GNAT family N-acetyltransferase, partial [Actinomycetota bacterium]|nr:GNAT family N-acetyltransferase [Actinomycetota bacterium]
MDLELRPVTEEELEAYLRVDSTAFGQAPPDADDAAVARAQLGPLERALAVFEGGRIVATAAAPPLELTLPGLTTTTVAALTYVGVLPTHRRRGLLRLMMGRLLEDARARGEAVALLLASESAIYGRFGYGLASSHVAVEIERRHGALLVPEGRGRVELVDAGTAAKVLPAVHDQARRRQPGDLGRSAEWWEGALRDPEPRREGASPRFYAVHESAEGEADGYASYRVKSRWEHGMPCGRVLVQEVVALSPGADAALWRFLLSIDLTEVVEAESRPVEDPLRWMLADPRRLRVTMASDFLWARLLDVGAALAARRYAVPGRLVLDVDGGFGAPGGRRYALEGGPDGAGCRPTDDDADLALGL